MSFKLPILYQQYDNIPNTMNIDLELSISNNDNKSVYECICDCETQCGSQLTHDVAKYYTTDASYLIHTQLFLKKLPITKPLIDVDSINNTQSKFCDIQNDNTFIESYQYINHSIVPEKVNTISIIMQLVSTYTVLMPISYILFPIMVVLLPLFHMIEMSLSEYILVLSGIIQSHQVGKLIVSFMDSSVSQKLYLLFYCVMYFISVYQSVTNGIKMCKNAQYMESYLQTTIKPYLTDTLKTMALVKKIVSKNKLYTYNEFVSNMSISQNTLVSLLQNIEKCSLSVDNVGFIMKIFYEMKYDTNIIAAMHYSFSFNGYMEIMCSISNRLRTKTMNNVASFTNDSGKTEFDQLYYPNLINNTDEIITNDVKLNRSMLITGPNASGKTTLLKSVLTNIILSQQFGCGCYKTATLTIYDKLYCYINVPDTSDRDSLFQAETRRCKTILDTIESSDTKCNHFCIFDELFSGTNPDEAAQTAEAFMKYIGRVYPTVKFMVTTHYTNLCKKIAKCKHKTIKNYNMKTLMHADNTLEYTYKLSKGISFIKGGIKTLIDMNYPTDIIKSLL